MSVANIYKFPFIKQLILFNTGNFVVIY